MVERALSAEEQSALENAIMLSLERAASGLSEMIGHDIRLSSPRVRFLPRAELRTRVAIPEGPAVAVYLDLRAGLPAQAVLIFAAAKARDLVDLLLDQPAGSTTELDEMASSALGEVGNVMGALFANSIAYLSGETVNPSTPTVREDGVCAILDHIAGAARLPSDEAFLIDTRLVQDDLDIDGHFLVLPNLAALSRIAKALRR